MRPWWREHSLTIVLGTALLVALVFSRVALVWWPGIQDGSAPAWPWWAWETVVSNEADIFGGLVLVWATKKLRERGSPESGDD